MAITDKTPDKKTMNMRSISYEDLTWIDIVQPTRDVFKFLSEQYHFNPLDLEDVLSPRQVPKIEEYPDYLFGVFHFSVYNKQTRISYRKQWSAFVSDKVLVTLRPVELKAPDEIFRECELSEEARERYMSQGSGYLLYQIIDRAIDFYFRVLDKILSLMEDIEDNVFKENVETALELSNIRRDINTQRRVMFPTRPLLIELEKKVKSFSKTDLTLYFSDLMDHMNKICDTLDEYTETIEVFKDADNLLSTYRTNRTIRTLAIFLAIGLPFILIAAIYLILPGDTNKGSNLTFFALLAFIAVLIGILLAIFRSRRIL